MYLPNYSLNLFIFLSYWKRLIQYPLLRLRFPHSRHENPSVQYIRSRTRALNRSDLNNIGCVFWRRCSRFRNREQSIWDFHFVEEAKGFFAIVSNWGYLCEGRSWDGWAMNGLCWRSEIWKRGSRGLRVLMSSHSLRAIHYDTNHFVAASREINELKKGPAYRYRGCWAQEFFGTSKVCDLFTTRHVWFEGTFGVRSEGAVKALASANGLQSSEVTADVCKGGIEGYISDPATSWS